MAQAGTASPAPLPGIQEELWKAHYPKLVRALRRRTRDGGAVADALQQLWLDTARVPPPADVSRDAARLFAWLLVAAQRRLIDLARRDRRRSHLPLPDVLPAGPGGDADRCGRIECVRRILRQLHETGAAPQARLLELRFLEGYSIRDISKSLGAPSRAVSARLQRAKREFRREWEACVGD